MSRPRSADKNPNGDLLKASPQPAAHALFLAYRLLRWFGWLGVKTVALTSQKRSSIAETGAGSGGSRSWDRA